MATAPQKKQPQVQRELSSDKIIKLRSDWKRLVIMAGGHKWMYKMACDAQHAEDKCRREGRRANAAEASKELKLARSQENGGKNKKDRKQQQKEAA